MDYGGLNISEAAIMQHMSSDVGQQVIKYQQQFCQPIVAITPAQDKGIARASIKQGVREVVLAKDQAGKLGEEKERKKKKTGERKDN
jgi:syntenin-1